MALPSGDQCHSSPAVSRSFFFSYGGRSSRDPVVIKVNDGAYKCVCEGQGALTCKSQTVHHSTVHGERTQ